ncbi:MAG: protein kinase [Lentisphaeria bacterium]|nr:protein kinase [Lentisphaeria bacterium]
MQTRIFNCPKCDGMFEYESDEIAEQISCPECGQISSSGEFSSVMLCPSCHKKLNVPLELLAEPELICPLCDQSFSTAESMYLSELSSETMISDFPEEDFLPKQMLQAGEIFDKFRIVKLLGRGGMGEVYLAEHLLFQRTCALKLLTDSVMDPVTKKRFIREAKISNEIDHPNIVKVYDIGIEPKRGYFFIAMEYIDGITLADEVKQTPFPEAALLEVLSVMTDALGELEAHQIVHRDIKPANIMRSRDGVLKLMDLGIARRESDAASGELTLTMAQSVMGTPGFASPEQSKSAHQTDIRSDFFSLGASLYYLAAGRQPFSGKTAIEIILNVMREDPVPISELRPDLSPGMQALIQKLMAKSPDDRPADVTDLKREIAMMNDPSVKRSQKGCTGWSKLNLRWLWLVLLPVVFCVAGMILWNSIPEKTVPAPVVPEVKPEWKPEPEPEPAAPTVPPEVKPQPAEKKAVPDKKTASVHVMLEGEAVTKEDTPKAEALKPEFQLDYHFIPQTAKRMEAVRATLEKLKAEPASERIRLMLDFHTRQLAMQTKMLERKKHGSQRRRYDAGYNRKIKEQLEAFLQKNQYSMPEKSPFHKELFSGLKSGRIDPMLVIRDNGGQKNPRMKESAFYELLLAGRMRPWDDLIMAATESGVDFSRVKLGKDVYVYGKQSTFYWWEYGVDSLDAKGISDMCNSILIRFDNTIRNRRDRKRFYGGTEWDLARIRSLLLCGYLNPNIEFVSLRTNLLHLAVDRGDLEMVRTVIGAGFKNFSAADFTGETPYIKALYGGHSEIAKCLEACNMATPVLPKHNVQIAFFNAVWKRDPAAIRAAMKQGADPNQIMRRGLTALQYGCMTRQMRMVNALLEAEVPTRAERKVSDTGKYRKMDYVNHPLVLAAINNSLPIFKLLLKHKVSYMDPVQYDWFHPRPVVFSLIELFVFQTEKLIPYFDELFKHGLDPNLVDPDTPANISPEGTLLVHAVWQFRFPDNGKFARYLIRKGAKTDKVFMGQPLNIKLKIISAD